jgi:hypothetical protein
VTLFTYQPGTPCPIPPEGFEFSSIRDKHKPVFPLKPNSYLNTVTPALAGVTFYLDQANSY